MDHQRLVDRKHSGAQGSGSFSVASVRDTPIVATRRRRFSIAACATLPGNALNSFCRASPYAARAVADSGHASKTDKRLVVK